MSSQYAYLIDASVIFFRYYFSMPNHWVSRCGQDTAAVYGYTHWLRRLLADLKPKYISACFDESLGSCFRNQIYPLYKSSRPPADDNIRFQLSACQEVSRLFGVSCYASNLFEADDLIGSLALRHRRQQRTCVIVSRDKDLGQLLKGEDFLWNYPDADVMGVDRFVQKFDVAPQQLPDYLALCGDPIDDIPGVPGIGKKTAAKLLAHFKSIEDLLNNGSKISECGFSSKLSEKIVMHSEQLLMAKKLATIECHVPFNTRVNLKKRIPQKRDLLDYVNSLGFNLSKMTL